MAKKKKGKLEFNLKNVIIILILIVLVIGYYVYTSKETKKGSIVQDEYTLLSSRDLETSYPETPREVVKLYSRMVKYLYDDSVSDEKVENIVNQMRLLFVDELLDKNALKDQIINLKQDVKLFTKAKKDIIGYEVYQESLEMKEVEGKEIATIIAGFSIKHNNAYEHTNEQFLLEKDKTGKWKIIGWQLADDYVGTAKEDES